ncbi:hydrogen peroxide-inducible genes activator [Algiphilus sp.]|uniref:hydrogen peroxide-inducible genes activator n=1 Tax=Algiphilus sp. TaxID=1872431 RepID=UPI0025C467FF|nr:hydrogen peroxide-inducible genes activator [Algiphilus sp.]MCK5770679.1 hydrogen peroxide-inducible genes activator [Algiphilus sp.]
MTLTELRYLVNLEKERHFGRAAERSFVSQPTLSVAIRKLEETLDVTLFERNRGEVRPTPVGERICAQAKRVLAEAARIEDLANEGKNDLVGPVRLGAIYTVGPYLLPYLVPMLRETAPEMPLILEENFTAQLLEQLHANELDAALVALPVESSQLHVWSVFDEDFIVLLPCGHRWAERESINASEMGEENLLLLGPGHCFREQVVEACPKCIDSNAEGPRPQTGSSLETIRHMVASEIGISVLPRSSHENRPEESQQYLVARPFADPVPRRRIALVWRKTFPRPEAIRVLRTAIVTCHMRGVDFRALDEPPEA